MKVNLIGSSRLEDAAARLVHQRNWRELNTEMKPNRLDGHLLIELV